MGPVASMSSSQAARTPSVSTAAAMMAAASVLLIGGFAVVAVEPFTGFHLGGEVKSAVAFLARRDGARPLSVGRFHTFTGISRKSPRTESRTRMVATAGFRPFVNVHRSGTPDPFRPSAFAMVNPALQIRAM